VVYNPRQPDYTIHHLTIPKVFLTNLTPYEPNYERNCVPKGCAFLTNKLAFPFALSYAPEMIRRKKDKLPRRNRGTGGLIKIKGCRYWYAQFYKDGRKFRESTRTTVAKEAEAILRQKMGDAERGLTPASALKKIRYGHLRQALLDDYAAQGYKSLQTLADGSETIWGLKNLDEFFGYKPPKELGEPVTAITTDAARKFARQRQAEGVGNAFINRSLAKLRRMLNIAYEDGKISAVPKIRMLKEPAARKGFLPRDQFESLLAALPEKLRPLITFLYYCGVRLGEAQQVDWSQVDLESGLIRLEEEQAKSGEARTVPIPDVLIEMLKPMELKQGLVFDSTNLRKSWVTACAAVGLGTLDKKTWRYSGLIVHDLRRSAIKNLMAAGVNEKVAMSISGHKTRSVFDRYHIVDSSDVISAMRRVEALQVPAAQVGTPRLLLASTAASQVGNQSNPTPKHHGFGQNMVKKSDQGAESKELNT
jgi:integrase